MNEGKVREDSRWLAREVVASQELRGFANSLGFLWLRIVFDVLGSDLELIFVNRDVFFDNVNELHVTELELYDSIGVVAECYGEPELT